MSRTLDENGLIVGKTDAIYTYSGGIIQPLNPDPDDIDIVDIAHALSNQCRYTGHTHSFYSVAEHSLLCAAYVRQQGGTALQQLTALLHDASEAYLSDIARPIKKAPEFGNVYVAFEKALERAIGQAFGISEDPFATPLVKEADERILGIEVHTLMPHVFVTAYGEIEPWDGELEPQCLRPERVKSRFLHTYDFLLGQVIA